MINFDTPEMIEQVRNLLNGMVTNIVRPIARYYDDHEHERPKELEAFAPIMQAGMGGGQKARRRKKKSNRPMTALAATPSPLPGPKRCPGAISD